MCQIERVCILKKALGEALEAFLAVLDRYTLADLLVPQPGLARLLDLPPASRSATSRKLK